MESAFAAETLFTFKKGCKWAFHCAVAIIEYEERSIMLSDLSIGFADLSIMLSDHSIGLADLTIRQADHSIGFADHSIGFADLTMLPTSCSI